ncbi:kinase-like protein, partial [Coprinopsis marcescibilis]
MTSSINHIAPGTIIANGTIQLQELIGEGGFGAVYKAVSVDPNGASPGQTLAVKVQSRTGISRGRANSQAREEAFHSHVSGSHPSILPLLEIYQNTGYLFFVMPYVDGGDLFGQMYYKRRYLGNSALIKSVFGQVLDAVSHLHDIGVFHRDLKAENILCYDKEGSRVAICDFGLATNAEESAEFGTGSIHHMSLGMFVSFQRYSPRANDIWSLGIILVNLVMGRNPWNSAAFHDETFMEYIISPASFLQAKFPISSSFTNLLVRVLEEDEEARISMREFCEEFDKIETF